MSSKFTTYSTWVASKPYLVGSFACLGGLLFGLDVASMAAVLNNPHYLSTYNFPTPAIQGGIVAAMPAGSLVGSFAVTQLADTIGRKKTIILAGIIWVIGSILQCASVDRGMLIAGRVIAGFSVGIASAVVPIYQAEITPPAIRGRVLTFQQWSIAWGIFIQYFVEFGCSYISGNASFRIPWGTQVIPAIILSAGMTVFPETPRFLFDHGYEDEALQVLADMHGRGNKNDSLVILEFEEIRQQVYLERTEGAKSYWDLLKDENPRRVFLGMSMQMWAPLCGISIMMYYIIYVFEGAGLTGVRVNLTADSVQYVINVVLTVPPLIYMDKWGRRPMLLIGSFLMGFWMFLVGGLQKHFGGWGIPESGGQQAWIISGHPAATKSVIVCSYLFVATYSLTMGPVNWTYPAELYSQKIRGKAVAISVAWGWTLNTALAFALPPAFSTIAWKTYFVFGTFNFVAFIQIFFMFPETVGRSLEEIEDIFRQGNTFTAWKISRDVGKKTLAEVMEKTGYLERVESSEGKKSSQESA